MTLTDLQTQWRGADHPELAASPAWRDRVDSARPAENRPEPPDSITGIDREYARNHPPGSAARVYE